MSKALRLAHSVLPVLILMALLAATVWIGLNLSAYRSVELPVLEQLSLISGLAYLFFLAGLSGLRIAFRQRNKLPARTYSWVLIFLLAFIIPLVISWLPGLVIFAVTSATRPFDLAGFLTIRQNWLPTLQAVALMILLLSDGEIRIDALSPAPDAPMLANAAVWGMGLWLVLVFSLRLLGALLPLGDSAIPASPLWLVAIMAPAGMVLLPVGQGILFRGRLLAAWQARYGPTAGSLLCAAVYALACMRPALWLPAFLVGLGLNWLAARGQGLRLPVMAHAVMNLIILWILPANLI